MPECAILSTVAAAYNIYQVHDQVGMYAYNIIYQMLTTWHVIWHVVALPCKVQGATRRNHVGDVQPLLLPLPLLPLPLLLPLLLPLPGPVTAPDAAM